MKKHYLFFAAICFLITNFIHAQSFEWAKKGSATFGQAYTYGITVDLLGNVYYSGWFTGSITFGGITLNSVPGTADIYLVKFNSAGLVQWAKSVGGSGDDYSYDCEVDAFGDIIITGGYGSSSLIFGTDTIDNALDGNIFLAKYNSAGNAIWAKGYAKGGAGQCYKMSVDQFGNSFITGSAGINAHFGADSLAKTGAFITKINSLGIVVWLAGADGGQGWGISNDSLGNVYACGNFYNDTIFFGSNYLLNTDPTQASQDCYIAKYNSAGVFQWVKAISGVGNGLLQGADSDKDGNTYVTGYSYNQIDFGNSQTLTPFGTNDFFLAKYNSAGTCMWAKQSNNFDASFGTDVSVNANEQIFIGGTFYTSMDLGTGTINAGASGDPFIAQFDSSGVAHWVQSATGNNGAETDAVCSDALNNCYMAGLYTGPYSFGSTVLLGTSIFSAKIGSLTSGNIISPLCAGSSVSIPFTTTSVHTGGNVYTADLSDATGSFNSPTNIGTLSSTASSGIINATIPVLTPAGTNYRVRIRSTSPVQTGNWQNSFTVNAAPATPQICMVTVDSLSQYNNIFWDKTAYTGVDSFYVYRDTANNNYACIGKIPFASLSQFIDTVRTLYAANGDPNASSWRYKIAIKDSCGILGNMSPYHQTIFFQHNTGNFNWSPYQIEGQPTPVPALSNYLFKRDDISSGIWNTIQTLSASSVLYTDANYTTYQVTGSWRVETQWSVLCNPTLKITPQAMAAVSKSRSNVQNNFAVTGINTITEKDFVLMPNPANDFIVIQSRPTMKNVVLEIYDVTGRIVISSSSLPTIQSSIQVNTSGLSNGIYSVRIISENGKVTKKLVIEK